MSAEWAGREEQLSKQHINDGQTDTIWAGPENSRAGWAQIDLGQDYRVERVLLSEGPDYARCAKFTVAAQIGGEWKAVVNGTGIGVRKELNFEPVTARYFRLTVATDKPASQPDGEPVIGEFQLFGE